MDMVGISSYFYWLAFQAFAYSCKTTMKFRFKRWVNEWFPVFGAKNEVHVIFHKWLSHDWEVVIIGNKDNQSKEMAKYNMEV